MRPSILLPLLVTNETTPTSTHFLETEVFSGSRKVLYSEKTTNKRMVLFRKFPRQKKSLCRSDPVLGP